MRYIGRGTGKDGVIDFGSLTQTWYTASGTSSATELTATGTFVAGDMIIIHQSRGGSNVGLGEENQVVSYTPGTITLLYPLERTYTDSGSEQAQVAVIPQASSTTGTYTVPAWDGDVSGGLYIKVSGTADGTINADGKGFRGGARGVPGNSKKGATGEGTVGASIAGQRTANGSAGGGGQTSGGATEAEGEGGGGGGYATAGSNGGFHISSGYEGLGGNLVGQADLTTGFFIGAGGGGGGGYDANPPADTRGPGRAGGGFVVVHAHTFANTLSISAKGLDSGLSFGDQGGGGAGSGGTIWLKGVKNLGATLTNTGGASAGGARAGGAGADGRTRIETCSNVVGTEDPSASLAEGGHDYCGGSAFIF